jgi:hypothetical protein
MIRKMCALRLKNNDQLDILVCAMVVNYCVGGIELYDNNINLCKAEFKLESIQSENGNLRLLYKCV